MTYFTMDAETAIEFYRRCIAQDVNDEEGRIAIMKQLMEEKADIGVGQFKGSKEGLIAKLSRSFKILQLKRKKQS